MAPAGPPVQTHILKSSLSNTLGPLATARLGEWPEIAILGQLELPKP